MGTNKDETSHYESLGVSSDKKEVHNAIKDRNKGIFPTAFCPVYADVLGNDPRYCICMHADGVGTKSSLAYLYWKETGDISVFRRIPTDAIVMNLDDLLCIGATGPFMMNSSIGRNKMLIPGEVLKEIVDGTEEFVDRMGKYGIQITTTGGETADVGDLVRTIMIDASMIARLP